MKIMLVDDHRMVRDGLRAILEKEGLQVVAEASNGHEALALASRMKPEIVIMDISMPDLNGIDATRRLLEELPSTKVIALSMHSDRRYVIAMFEAGAVGYLLKNAAAGELLQAVATVAEGLTYISPAVAGTVLTSLGHERGASSSEKPQRTRARGAPAHRGRQVVQGNRDPARLGRAHGRDPPAPNHGQAQSSHHRGAHQARGPRRPDDSGVSGPVELPALLTVHCGHVLFLEQDRRFGDDPLCADRPAWHPGGRVPNAVLGRVAHGDDFACPRAPSRT